MIPPRVIARIEPQCVGGFITKSRYNELTKNFKTNFPGEITSIMLSKSAIEIILNDTNVSGIKFMNGIENARDPSSRILVLIPANYTNKGSLPNSLIKADGFLTNTGDNISLEQTWQVLFNHVLNYKKINADIHYTKINRGSFMGRNILTELAGKAKGDTLIYHFGYDIENNYPYKALIQPEANGIPIGDESHPCPGSAGCPKSVEEMCALTRIITNLVDNDADGQLNELRAFRDKLLQNSLSGAEIEKYYTISASLLETIDMEPNHDLIYEGIYEAYIKPSLHSLANHNEEAAYILFREALEHLTTTYLYQ